MAVVLLFRHTSSTAYRISLSAFSCISSLCNRKSFIHEVKMAFSFSWSNVVSPVFHDNCCWFFPSVYISLLPAEQPGFPSSDNFAAQGSTLCLEMHNIRQGGGANDINPRRDVLDNSWGLHLHIQVVRAMPKLWPWC